MATENAIYRCEHSDTLFEVTNVPDRFGVTDPSNQQIEAETVADGEWYSFYRDNFRKGFVKVAGSRAELNESQMEA